LKPVLRFRAGAAHGRSFTVLKQDESKLKSAPGKDSAVLQKTNTLVGRLVEVSGDVFTARLISVGGEFQSERMIGMHKVRIGQVGSYLKISQAGDDMVCMVDSIWQEKDADGKVEHMTRLAPLGELGINGEFKRGLANYPTTGAEVHALSTMQLERIFTDTAEAQRLGYHRYLSERLQVFRTPRGHSGPDRFR
jgi:hypothetical protein